MGEHTLVGVEHGQVWLTREGKTVHITGIIRSAETSYPVLGTTEDGHSDTWTSSGRNYKNRECRHDLVKLKEEEGTMYNVNIATNTNSTGNTFFVVDDDSRIVSAHPDLATAKNTAQRAVKQDNYFIILQAITKVMPKPLDVDFEDLTTKEGEIV